MRRVSGGGGVSAVTLARVAVPPDRRLPHRVIALSDSRIAAICGDLGGLVLSNRLPLNWANALLDQLKTLLNTFSVPGHRTDQMAVRIDAAIPTGTGLHYRKSGMNDIAQRHAGADASGAVAADTLATPADRARTAGVAVVTNAEVGSNSLDAVQVA